MTLKPQTADGYTPGDAEQVRAACLTIALTLGDLMDELRIIGGLVPGLILPAPAEEVDRHIGTNDLDVGLSVALLDEQRYTEISKRLRGAGFHPARNINDNPQRQTWQLRDLRVTVDFLIAPLSPDQKGGRIQNLEHDFAAIIAPGLPLAFDEAITVALDGHGLNGDRGRRDVHVAGPGAFTVLKALAFRARGEPKDSYDLCHVLRHWPDRAADIAQRLAKHRDHHDAIVDEAVAILAADFADTATTGPRKAARFLSGADDEDAAADAHGAVADLLVALRRDRQA